MLNRRVFGSSVLVVFVLVLVAVPVSAAPAAGPADAGVCSSQRIVHSLGVDGGLTGLSRGEFTPASTIASSARPLGVDGGLTSLLFSRSEASGVTGYAAVSCGSAPAGS